MLGAVGLAPPAATGPAPLPPGRIQLHSASHSSVLQFRLAGPAQVSVARLGTANTPARVLLRPGSRSTPLELCADAMKQHRGVLCLLLAAVALLCCRTAGADPCLDEQAMQAVIDGALEHLQGAQGV